MSQALPFTTADTSLLHDGLRQVIADGASPGGVVVCGTASHGRTVLSAGVISPEVSKQAPDERTVYDIASLTKVVATWPLVGRALDTGLLDLDSPVREFLPLMDGPTPSADVTVRELLSHTSGLRPSTRLDLYAGADRPLYELIAREPLESAAGGHRYINRGFILLGYALAHVHMRHLNLLADDLWAELGMHDTTYGPLPSTRRIAPTEQRPGAPRLWGTVHDENAATMGGTAGHAGAFSTADDLATYAEALLDPRPDNPLGTWLSASMAPHAEIEPGLHRGLGWILASGNMVAYHHGFTGTSFYLAPATGRYIALATNAIHNGTARTRIAPLRELILKTITAT
ncbi:beta-lactamase family protein [Streptomyces sp. APSN-46.1]|uniref:serine hydrolase domain-containing protein n=1 Tax=Streptomyces sp. APSN-46.1 TaxID=2929049 RepID=UPI001FB48EEE|nr:serine hydrolase domain-containing protein [Streptomyces sp. APSN-46.1]MCJ1678521.1 beta-lactamase family protein [Streptomyces sp. APSN-46.1]